jgi:hypothetical protein
LDVRAPEFFFGPARDVRAQQVAPGTPISPRRSVGVLLDVDLESGGTAAVLANNSRSSKASSSFRACQRVSPAKTSPKRRARSRLTSLTRISSNGACSVSGGSKRLGCVRRPVIRSASARALRRPFASSFPNRATISCRTRRPWRTDRTSTQYSWVLPFSRTVLRRRCTVAASSTVVATDPGPINGVRWHYTAPEHDRDGGMRAAGSIRPQNRLRIPEAAEVGLGSRHGGVREGPLRGRAPLARRTVRSWRVTRVGTGSSGIGAHAIRAHGIPPAVNRHSWPTSARFAWWRGGS